MKQNRLVVESDFHMVCFLGKQDLGFRSHFKGEIESRTSRIVRSSFLRGYYNEKGGF